MKIVIVRLANGEEVISKVDDSELSNTPTGYLKLVSPRVVHVVDMGNGRATAQLLPVMLTNGVKDECLLNLATVPFISYDADPEHEKRYLAAISNIQLV